MTPSSVPKREWAGVNNNQGSNWIRKAKRIAIYLRDGWRCVWCGHKGGTHKYPGLSLDHLIPRGARGGTNHSRNLVTACLYCNRRKGHLTLKAWADRLGPDGDVQILRVVERARKVPLDMERAKKIVAKRKGTCEYKEKVRTDICPHRVPVYMPRRNHAHYEGCDGRSARA